MAAYSSPGRVSSTGMPSALAVERDKGSETPVACAVTEGCTLQAGHECECVLPDPMEIIATAKEKAALLQDHPDKKYLLFAEDRLHPIKMFQTCSVTNVADKKSRQMLHRAKRMNPDSVVVAAGCYVQVAADILEKDGCVDVIIGNNQKAQLARILDGYLEGREDSKAHVLDIDHTNEYESMRVSRISGHSRAFIKVQDGCNQFCSYCIIPYHTTIHATVNISIILLFSTFILNWTTLLY